MFINDKETLKSFYSKNRLWQGIASVEKSVGGRLFAVFYSGNNDEGADNFCVVLKSDDDGKSWTEPICAAYAGDTHRCFDPNLWIDLLGRLWFFWCRGYENITYAVICDDPDAKELEWCEEFVVGTGVMMNKPTVLSSGEWLFPISVWNYDVYCATVNGHCYFYNEYPDRNEYKNSGANIYISRDNGKTITFLGGCVDISYRSYDEHMIYEKNDGVLVMLLRTAYGISRSFSYDRGITWTRAPSLVIPGPSSRFFIRRLSSGRLLMVNHYKYSGRNNLTAMLSEDDGETWPYKLTFDERDNVSYPDAVQDAQGNIYIIYDRERGGDRNSIDVCLKSAREVLLAKMTEEDIIAGKIVSDGSYTKMIVSKLGEYNGKKDFFAPVRKLDSEKLADELVKGENVEKILSMLFSFYSVSCQNMHCVDVQKMDKYVNAIKSGADVRKNIVLLAKLLDDTEVLADKTREEPIVSHVMSCVQNNITDEIDVSSLAKELNVSVYYLCHLFKNKTGLSILEYRNSCRFALAKKLLVQTDMKISEIGSCCGFADYSFFAKKFRQSEKISPSQYRILNKK